MRRVAPPQFRKIFAHAASSNQCLSATIEVTHRCHLACIHCYLDDRHEWRAKNAELTTEELKSVIDDLRAMGCLFLTLTGGEIFIRKDIITVARHARSAGMAVTLYTTGTLFKPSDIDAIVNLYPWGVEFSVYSDVASIHDAITKEVGSFDKTMWALRTLKCRGVRVLMKCPIMRENFSSFQGLKSLAEELDISFIADVNVTASNDGALSPTRSRLGQKQLQTFFADETIRASAAVNTQATRADDNLCSIGQRSCLIGPFGHVYTCMGYKKPLGNVRETSLYDVWKSSPELARIRSLRAADLKICSSCHKLSYCSRCAGTALTENGDMLGPSTWSCHLAAAKEKAAGVEVLPSAAERAGLVSVSEQDGNFTLSTQVSGLVSIGAHSRCSPRGEQR